LREVITVGCRKREKEMKRRIVISLILFVSIIALTSANVHAAAAANTFKFTDTYVQKVLCSKVLGYCDVFDGGKFTITAKISLANIDITKFDRDTEFYIYVGRFDWYCQLGEDPRFIPGKSKSAKIVVIPEEPDYYGHRAQYLQLQFKWSPKQLVITITGITPDALAPIWADDYLYNYDDPSVNDVTDAYIEFGNDVKVYFNPIYVKGKATVKYDKKYGGDVSNIKLTGTGNGVPVTEEP
jgi:hypothetical protein